MICDSLNGWSVENFSTANDLIRRISWLLHILSAKWMISSKLGVFSTTYCFMFLIVLLYLTVVYLRFHSWPQAQHPAARRFVSSPDFKACCTKLGNYAIGIPKILGGKVKNKKKKILRQIFSLGNFFFRREIFFRILTEPHSP